MARPLPVDAVDRAIETAKPVVQLITVQGTLNSGRPCVISVPVDVTELELLSLLDGVLRIGDQLRARRLATVPGPRLLVPD